MKHVSILFVQLPVPSPVPISETANHPMAAASLWAASRKTNPNIAARMMLLPQHVADHAGDDLLVRMILDCDPSIVAFTCYLWNVQRSLFISNMLKGETNATILIGGPEVSPDNDWLLNHPGWDRGVCGEGETHWLSMMKQVATTSRDRALGTNRNLVSEPFTPFWLHGLEALHRWEHLSGRHESTPFVEVGRGCSSSCVFCRYSEERYPKRVIGENALSEELAWAAEHEAMEVFLLDPGLTRRPRLQEFFRLLARFDLRYSAELEGSDIDGTRAALLVNAGVTEVEIGLQSSIDRIRRDNGCRGSAREVIQGCRHLLDRGAKVRVDLIVGLPGDTEDGVLTSARTIRKMLPEAEVQLFPLLILPGTRLRRTASDRGVLHQSHPPHAVISTSTMNRDQLLSAWESAEKELGIREVLCWPDLGEGCGHDDIICRILVSTRETVAHHEPEPLGSALGSELGNAICVRFVAVRDDAWPLDWMRRFLTALLLRNPFVSVDIVLEGGVPPTRSESLALAHAISQPWHYLNHRRLESPEGIGRLYYLIGLEAFRRIRSSIGIPTIVVLRGYEEQLTAELAASGEDVLLLVEDCSGDQRIENAAVRCIDSWRGSTVGRTVFVPDRTSVRTGRLFAAPVK